VSGTNFPVDKYYRDNILDARTITHSGSWWSAILVIRDPKTLAPFVALYKWRKRDGEWKKATSFKINKLGDLQTIQAALEEFSGSFES
jgi:hypothetical protein